MGKKEEKLKDNKFTYFSDKGLKILSEKDIIDEISNKKESSKDIKKFEEDKIQGGKADNLTVDQIAEKHGVSVKNIKKQIKLGKKVEMEHTDDPKKAKEIARDHISEFKDYYTRLAKMEDEAKKENKKDE